MSGSSQQDNLDIKTLFLSSSFLNTFRKMWLSLWVLLTLRHCLLQRQNCQKGNHIWEQAAFISLGHYGTKWQQQSTGSIYCGKCFKKYPTAVFSTIFIILFFPVSTCCRIKRDILWSPVKVCVGEDALKWVVFQSCCDSSIQSTLM